MQKIIGEMLSFVNMINGKIDQLAIFADGVKREAGRSGCSGNVKGIWQEITYVLSLYLSLSILNHVLMISVLSDYLSHLSILKSPLRPARVRYILSRVSVAWSILSQSLFRTPIRPLSDSSACVETRLSSDHVRSKNAISCSPETVKQSVNEHVL
jgi:hypothetical protein